MPVNSRCSIHLIAFFVSQLELNNMLLVSFDKKHFVSPLKAREKSSTSPKIVENHVAAV